MSIDLTIESLWEETFCTNPLDERKGTATFFPVPFSSGPEQPASAPPSGVVIQRLIGQGGFADVYTAHQGSLRRDVAVKQIREARSASHLQFFHYEARLTAGLNHPNILPIHDLINIDDRPSLVMKRVQGKAWNEHIAVKQRQQALVLADEIQRLVDVCDAVAFAHSRGVLHLDLKPANVMCGAFGENLVMDWGCAALFDDTLWQDQPDLPRTQSITRPFGTPAFMAPELARGEGPALGPHTDLYLLGAILHLLLSGAPIRKGVTARSTIRQAVQGARQPLPEDAPALLAQLCLDATDPDPEQRTSSIATFRWTLQHWLDTRESRALTERALARLTALEQATHLNAAERQEGTQLLGVFEQAGRAGTKLPGAVEGEQRLRRLLARTALQNGEPGVARILALPLPPEQRATIQQQAQTLQAQQTQQAHNDAWLMDAICQDGGDHILPQLHQILQLQIQAFGPEHPSTLQTRHDLAMLYQERGQYPEAEQHYTQLLEIQEQTLGKEHPRTLQVVTRMAGLYSTLGRYTAAEQMCLRALTAQERHLGKEHPQTLESADRLGGIYTELGRYAEGEALYVRTLEIQSRVLGPEHPQRLRCQLNLVILQSKQGQYAEAEALVRQILDVQSRVLGEDHLDTVKSLEQLGIISYQQGRYDDALECYQRALRIQTDTLGLDHPRTLWCVTMQGILHFAQGDAPQAEQILRQTRTRCEETIGAKHPLTLKVIGYLITVLLSINKFDELEALHRYLSHAYEQRFGPKHPETINIINNLGCFYHRQKRYSEAAEYFRQAIQGNIQWLGPQHPDTITCMNNLANALLGAGQPEEAEPILLQTRRVREELLGIQHPDTISSVLSLGRLYLSMERVSDALAHYQTALKHYTEGHHTTLMTQLGPLAQRLIGENQDADALPLLHALVALLRQHHGPADPRTLTQGIRLLETLTRLGQQEEADTQRAELHAAALAALEEQPPSEEQAPLLAQLQPAEE